jgi:hypothetical protein
MPWTYPARMKHVLILLGGALVCVGSVLAKENQSHANALSAMRAALKAKDLPEARRQALVAIDNALVTLPSCGIADGLGNPNDFAFFSGEAERVFVQRYGLIGFFDLRSGQVRRVWSAILGDRKSIPASNAFSAYHAKLGKISIDLECGNQPKFGDTLTLFRVVVPPGSTAAGVLSASGVFTSLISRAFDTRQQVPNGSIYRQWIIPVPGNR